MTALVLWVAPAQFNANGGSWPWIQPVDDAAPQEAELKPLIAHRHLTCAA
jgi:hypothetical protein